MSVYKVRGAKGIGPLVPENFEVLRKYFMLNICNLLQVNFYVCFLTLFHIAMHYFPHQLKVESFWQNVSASAM